MLILVSEKTFVIAWKSITSEIQWVSLILLLYSKQFSVFVSWKNFKSSGDLGQLNT